MFALHVYLIGSSSYDHIQVVVICCLYVYY